MVLVMLTGEVLAGVPTPLTPPAFGEPLGATDDLLTAAPTGVLEGVPTLPCGIGGLLTFFLRRREAVALLLVVLVDTPIGGLKGTPTFPVFPLGACVLLLPTIWC
jgi:hypothetical protein